MTNQSFFIASLFIASALWPSSAKSGDFKDIFVDDMNDLTHQLSQAQERWVISRSGEKIKLSQAQIHEPYFFPDVLVMSSSHPGSNQHSFETSSLLPDIYNLNLASFLTHVDYGTQKSFAKKETLPFKKENGKEPDGVDHPLFKLAHQPLEHLIKSMTYIPADSSEPESLYTWLYPTLFDVYKEPIPRNQGLKVHVGAKQETAYKIASLVLLYLQENNIAHKIVRSDQKFHILNEMVDQKGKFITIYPETDRKAVTIAKEIDTLLFQNGLTKEHFITAPHDKILPTSLSHGVSYRYGAYKEDYLFVVDSKGKFVKDKDGKFIKFFDDRNQGHKPSFMTWPTDMSFILGCETQEESKNTKGKEELYKEFYSESFGFEDDIFEEDVNESHATLDKTYPPQQEDENESSHPSELPS